MSAGGSDWDDGPDEYEMTQLNDPVRNLRVGVVFPILRSVGLVLLVLIAAISLSVLAGSPDLFWAGLLIGIVFLFWLERSRHRQRAIARRASDRLFGIRR
ncbi:MAG: hypothetical protein JSS55_03030 [Proteobacteria bacterium]|nr:hypothetical protein [Pseudomonadota bacterium]